MNMTIKRIFSSIGVGAVAIILGLGIQYALAAWTSPGTGYPAGTDCAPPNCNVPAPINVSGGGENGTATYPQTKTGFLTLANFIFNPTLTAGSVPEGDVLAAIDNNGTVGWVSTSSLGINNTGGGTTNNYYNMNAAYITPNGTCNRVANGYDNVGNVVSWREVCNYTSTSTWQVPAGVTSVLVEVWGGGGGGHYEALYAPSGGSAGAFNSKVYTVIPGQVFKILVGDAGYGGAFGGYGLECTSYSTTIGMGGSGQSSSAVLYNGDGSWGGIATTTASGGRGGGGTTNCQYGTSGASGSTAGSDGYGVTGGMGGGPSSPGGTPGGGGGSGASGGHGEVLFRYNI
jgi:hypothetical protein